MIMTNSSSVYLEMIWSGSLAYETARTKWSKSLLMLTGTNLVGSAAGSAPIGKAERGACGPPPIRKIDKSLKLAILECGERSFVRP